MYENLVHPLENAGYKIFFFVSTWDVAGDRSSWFGETIDKDIECIRNELRPHGLYVEHFDRESFLNRFETNKWKEYAHLSNRTTSGDAVSMYYKLAQCWKMLEDAECIYGHRFDLVVRTRPDLYLCTPLQTDIFPLEKNIIYMPTWHGKYREVNCTFADYFAIGTRDTMKHYMNIYNHIRELMTMDIPHTGEGYLYGQVERNNLRVRRLDKMQFGLMRINTVEFMS